ncbi:Z-ring formation inhibitor MciZ [Tepidibacillus infernus]|nr:MULTISPECIES: Z-ring formation inhibitor MciZ [Tepidibacillus]GBF12540.1 hypothetical protein HK1_02606 [Tepidibacillus sp. HK-1]
MKVIRTPHQLKMIGKAWEIRAKLSELSKSKLTVQQYLQLFSH